MGPITIDRDRHVLCTPPVYGYLRRAFPEYDGKRKYELFVYRHARTRNFVVALWLNRARGRALEVHIIGPDPNRFPPDEQKALRVSLSHLSDPGTLAAILKSQRYEHERAMNLSGERYVDDTRRMHRDAYGPSHVARARGWSPPG